MKTFKIRDLMIALRPGIGTPQRPKPFDWCLVSCDIDSNDCGGDSIQPFDTGGCDACSEDPSCDGCSEDPTCGACSEDPTCGACSEDPTCGACSQVTCGACSDHTCGCTRTCGACSLHWTVHCTLGCTQACTRAITWCEISICARASCGLSLKQPQIERMAPAQLARLKAQLRAASARVQKRESALAAAAEKKAHEPKTVDQVASLEKLLSEALEALRTRRAELQKLGESKGNQPDQKKKKD